jgi:hypothetical protein
MYAIMRNYVFLHHDARDHDVNNFLQISSHESTY